MKYLCLIYEDESLWPALPQDTANQMMSEYGALTEDLKKSGHYVGGAQLQTSNTATTVRVRNAKMLSTDGPFIETKEQLAGYYLVEARDLNDAIAIASRIPSSRHGAIEVRPLVERGG
ncbi:MAG: YciI family protein [bacterium]